MTPYVGSCIRSVLLIAALSVAGAGMAAPPSGLQGEALLQALRSGGYSIYFRHAATDWSLQDQVSQAGDWESCDPTRMRQLSDEGRRAAKAIGEAMRAQNIPVGQVLASPYCRTVETARLLGLGDVQPTTDVVNLRVAAYFGGRDAIIATAQRLLSVPPKAGRNTVIVAHGNVAREATPVYPGEGEGVVFKGDGDGGFEYVGRIAADQWRTSASQ